ncbi:hypothetical protein DH2020_013521 [Rehmannia glutinosa]|uniref:C2H2-type domain-containing protein n=1 Tax=Rehmannia glutinosa TaxID=99300 RepID=A0ABR0X5M4_REHGL
MLSNIDPSPPPPDPFSYSENGSAGKRKRRPAGTPDPDAEVVSLSPKTLLESDRYVCEICNQGFQRDQNLQMHRRRHKLPPPRPRHALGDLVGIKKHFRRKHSNQKQWVCEKCSKGYAVQSDYKAHLKTCGTRGHSCDCGRVFSRVESFIEHQDACTMGRLRSDSQILNPPPPAAAACLSRTASSPSPSSDTNLSVVAPWAAGRTLPLQNPIKPIFLKNTAEAGGAAANSGRLPNLELQLLTNTPKPDDEHSTQLQLSIGSSEINGEKTEADSAAAAAAAPARLKEEAQEHLRIAMAEKAYAEEARRQAKRQIEVAEQELTDAKLLRRRAQAELEKAQALKEHAVKQINSTMLEITCHSCKHMFQKASSSSSSLGLGYISAALKEWEIKKGDHHK